MRLKDKVALITGAGAGIGRATAKLFAKEGAKLVLTDINFDNVNSLAEEIKSSGGEAIALEHDVTSEHNWIVVVQEAVKAFERIDCLFNNAGIYIIKPITEISVEQWNALMAINVTGVFLGMKHVAPIMAEQKSGSIINSSSIAGLKGGVGHALYGASKGAVRIMTKSVAMEYAPYNIRVNSIHPGYIKTGMLGYAVSVSKKSEEELGSIYPLKRLGEVEDVANVVLFLASDESKYITAEELVIDGGVTNRV